MRIHLDHVLPRPLEDQDIAGSDIWNNVFELPAAVSAQVIAPSGTGKSTLLHILYGLRKDYAGKATLGETEMAQCRPGEMAQIRQQKLSIVFQDMRLFGDMSGIENLMLKAALTETTDETALHAMCAQLGIGHLTGRKCGNMSLGEQQRFAIIRALAQPFSLLLLDEPFSHLDPENRKRASKLILDTCAENRAGFLLASLEEDKDLPCDKQFHL